MYSTWCLYRLCYNNILITYNYCTEEEYKKEVFSACGVVTVVLSLAYFMTNPYLVLLAVGAFTALVFAVYATHTRKWECGESVMA